MVLSIISLFKHDRNVVNPKTLDQLSFCSLVTFILST